MEAMATSVENVRAVRVLSCGCEAGVTARAGFRHEPACVS